MLFSANAPQTRTCRALYGHDTRQHMVTTVVMVQRWSLITGHSGAVNTLDYARTHETLDRAEQLNSNGLDSLVHRRVPCRALRKYPAQPLGM